jgi:hypothetical protein
VKIEAEHPRVAHEVAPDGLSIHSAYKSKDGGSVSSSVHWDDLDTAVMNYTNAARSFERRIPQLEERLSKLTGHECDESRLRTYGNWYVIFNSGPPLWWYPKPRIKRKDGRWSLGIGWLYWCVQADQKKRGEE